MGQIPILTRSDSRPDTYYSIKKKNFNTQKSRIFSEKFSFLILLQNVVAGNFFYNKIFDFFVKKIKKKIFRLKGG